MEMPLGNGLQLPGVLDFQNEIDAWGTVELPAGRFECLRLHQIGTGTFTYTGLPELGALGELTAEIDGYAGWCRIWALWPQSSRPG